MIGPKKSRRLRAALPFVLGGLLAGCGGPAYNPLSPPPEARSVLAAPPEAEVVVLPNEPVPVVGLDNIEVGPPPIFTHTATTNLALPPPLSTMSFGRGWIPLTAWSSRWSTAQPERSASGGAILYRVPTRSGTCVLTIGSRLAQWNGTSIWLGFAPQLVGGQPHIHALDAEKTLEPLNKERAQAPTPIRIIVLDPGHGGTDGGTRGARNQLEKEYTLDWALRTERRLTNAGWKVFLTRRTDVDVSLTERVAFADRVRADLFLSLHFNSTFPQTQPSGIETYCLTPKGMPSTLIRGYSDDERVAYPNNAFDAANLEWAFRIHRSVVKAARAHDDGVKRARFMGVLRYQNRPAVLVEGGFLSNAREAANIYSAAHRETLAQAVAEAIK